MNKFQILYELIWFANAKKQFTAQDVANHFHVSTRTAYRYITDVSELGFYLYAQKGRNGGFQTLSNQLLPPVLFTNDEVFAILFAFQSIGYYNDFPFKVDVSSTNDKLLQILAPDVRDKVERLDAVFRITASFQPVKTPYLTKIIEASMQQLILQFNYHAISKQSFKEVAPIGVYAANGLWYFMGVDMSVNEQRVYRIDRMYDVVVTSRIHPVKEKIDSLEKPHVLVDPLSLKVLLTREGVKLCQEKRYFVNTITLKDDGSGILETEISRHDVAFTADLFLLMGKDAVVKEPQEMVVYLKNKVKDLLDIYSSLS